MDEEDVEFFEEDIRKIDKIENRKWIKILIAIFRCDGNFWGYDPHLSRLD